jgi:hypothetical protein
MVDERLLIPKSVTKISLINRGIALCQSNGNEVTARG